MIATVVTVVLAIVLAVVDAVVLAVVLAVVDAVVLAVVLAGVVVNAGSLVRGVGKPGLASAPKLRRSPMDRDEVGTMPPVMARNVHVKAPSLKTDIAAQLWSLAQMHLQNSAMSVRLTMPGTFRTGSRTNASGWRLLRHSKPGLFSVLESTW